VSTPVPRFAVALFRNEIRVRVRAQNRVRGQKWGWVLVRVRAFAGCPRRPRVPCAHRLRLVGLRLQPRRDRRFVFVHGRDESVEPLMRVRLRSAVSGSSDGHVLIVKTAQRSQKILFVFRRA